MTKPNINTPDHYYYTVRASNGKGPYEKPLPYELRQADVTSFWTNETGTTASIIDIVMDRTDKAWVLGASANAYNQAYARFQQEITDRANWAETLAQYKETYELGKLLFASSWEDLERIARIYKRAKYKWAVPLKYLNEAYLIWVYALHPLISDCQATAKILSSDVTKPIKARGAAKDTPPDDDRSGHWYFPSFTTTKVNVKIGATATVTNPNLERAQAMGLTNPIALAWDLVPFSFVFDWFYDFGGFLHSLDDLFGIELKDSYVSRSARTSGWKKTHWGGPASPISYDNKSSGFAFYREVGNIPLPTPRLKLNLSKWQIVHGLSLLAGIAGSKIK
jgi:hypothetical protein